MAAPNIVAVTTITGKTSVYNIGSGDTTIISNPAASGKVFKINFIRATNVDGTNPADFSLKVSDGTTTAYAAYTITIPQDTALTVIGKDDSFYMEEGYTVVANTANASDISVVCSYEEIS